ncbi:hypothetical protein AB6D13_20620 [Vibrio cyclitrophicus]
MGSNTQNTTSGNEHQSPIPSNVTVSWICKNLTFPTLVIIVSLLAFIFGLGFQTSEYFKNADATLVNKTKEDNYALQGELKTQKIAFDDLKEKNKKLSKELNSTQDTAKSLQDKNKELRANLSVEQESAKSLVNKYNQLSKKLENTTKEKQSLEAIITSEKRNTQDLYVQIEKLNKQLESKPSVPTRNHYEKVLSRGEVWQDPYSGINIVLTSIVGTPDNLKYTVYVDLPNSEPYKKDVRTGTSWSYSNEGINYKSTVTWLDSEDRSITLTIDKI